MVIKLLKDYKKNVASVELSKIKINEWKSSLKKDAIEISELYQRKSIDNLGIRNKTISSPTESIVMRSDVIKSKIKVWIKEEQLKISELEKEIKKADILLDSLPLEDKFILELKYKEKDKWNIITRKFNKEYRNQYDEYITVSGIKQKKDVIVERLEKLLSENSSSKAGRN